MADGLVGVSIAIEPGTAYYIPCGHISDAQQLSIQDLITYFGPIFANKNITYQFNHLTLAPEGRDLKIYPDYVQICREIKNRCFASLNIQENRTKNLIYGRSELARKNLLNMDSDFLRANNIEKVTLSSLSFKETISLLAQAKSFTYMVGAGVFYLLYLDVKIPVLEINPAKNNSPVKDYFRTILNNKEMMDIFEYTKGDIENRYLNNKDFEGHLKKGGPGVGLISQKELFIIIMFGTWYKLFNMSM